MADCQSQKVGKVYLVGAGPGDPGAITRRAVECLGRADVVFYDYLVNPAILTHVAGHAQRHCLGHHRGGRIWQQGDINQQLVDQARRGLSVVRLKGGDPDVFGRCADERQALREAGIAYEVVPGVTAAQAVVSHAGVGLLSSANAGGVALITGHQRSDKGPAELDYGLLADFPGTLVFYMGVTSARAWSEALMRRGRSADTPVAIVRRCCWGDQQTVRCTLGTVVETMAGKRLRPPSLFVVGDATAGVPWTTWYDSRPLRGACVMITRPADEAAVLRQALLRLGAEVVVQPAIEIGPVTDREPIDAAIDRLAGYYAVAFTSGQGVRYFLDRLHQRGADGRLLATNRLAAVGPGTARELARYGLRADVVPERFEADALADALAADAAGRRFLLPCGSRGRPVLRERLEAAGAEVDQVVVYRAVDVGQAEPAAARMMAEGRIDYVTVTSPATAESVCRMFAADLSHARLVSISPLTSQRLHALGQGRIVEAPQASVDGIIDAILADWTPGE